MTELIVKGNSPASIKFIPDSIPMSMKDAEKDGTLILSILKFHLPVETYTFIAKSLLTSFSMSEEEKKVRSILESGNPVVSIAFPDGRTIITDKNSALDYLLSSMEDEESLESEEVDEEGE